MTDRFDRQLRIPGWDQEKLARGAVLVYGREFTGTFTVWALASMGVGEIVWLGAASPATDRFAAWLVSDPTRFPGSVIYDLPVALERPAELAWAAGEHRVSSVIACAEQHVGAQLCRDLARDIGASFFAATTASGGWYGGEIPVAIDAVAERPITSMVLAAILADSAREVLCPLGGGIVPPAGLLPLTLPRPSRRVRVRLCGAGGVGVWAATLLALLPCDLYRIEICDYDSVEEHNLPRQGLYSPDDAVQGAPKAVAVSNSLRRLVAGSSVTPRVERIDEENSRRGLGSIDLVLSAVDNARTRLVLQAAGIRAGIPVVHAGTDVFAADCFVQDSESESLDHQMNGALSAALAAEAAEVMSGGCAVNPSYVVPGMMAGGMMAGRALQRSELYKGLPPLKWRAGALPVESRGGFDDIVLEGR